MKKLDEIIDLKDVLHWAKSKRPEAFVGDAASRWSCPLANYLNETRSDEGRHWSVGYGYATSNKGKEEEAYYELDDTYRSIIRKVDWYDRPVTAAELIAILEES